MELAELTAVLRDATLQIHGAVSEQNIQLESIKQSATENVDEINRQKKKVRLLMTPFSCLLPHVNREFARDSRFVILI
jgi:hypothetical protein